MKARNRRGVEGRERADDPIRRQIGKRSAKFRR